MENDFYKNRLVKFTSSEISRLVSKGKSDIFSVDGNTYIEEKLHEYQAGRRIQNEHDSKPTTWGSWCENYVFTEYLQLKGYSIDSKNVLNYKGEHNPLLEKYYAGSPDICADDVVGDIKCPFTIKTYLTALNCETITELRDKLKDGDKYYWQLISNAILTGKNKCLLYFWIPKGYKAKGEEESEVERIHELMRHDDTNNAIKWSMWCETSILPSINNPNTPNIKLFEFNATEKDKEFLATRILLASEILDKKINNFNNKYKLN